MAAVFHCPLMSVLITRIYSVPQERSNPTFDLRTLGATLSPMGKQVILDLPEGAFSALRVDAEELGRELRLAAAVKWYELGKLSQAKAAEVAGLSRFEFIEALSRFKVSPIQETIEELAEGLARER